MDFAEGEGLNLSGLCRQSSGERRWISKETVILHSDVEVEAKGCGLLFGSVGWVDGDGKH